MPGVDHVILNCNNYEESKQFYEWLMPRLGYKPVPNPEDWRGWYYVGSDGKTAGAFWIKPADRRFQSDRFDKSRVGLCEIAFKAESRRLINEVAKEIEAHGGQLLTPPQEYAYEPGYYAAFFADPDGIKLEIVTRSED